MKINSNVRPLVFEEDGCRLVVAHDTRGEPFREGVEFSFDDGRSFTRVMLQHNEVKKLRERLNEFLEKHK